MKHKILIIGGGALALTTALLLSGRANASEMGALPVATTPGQTPVQTPGQTPGQNVPVTPPTGAPSVSLPRGIRNNNPGNIKKSASQWVGKVGNDGTFETFDTPYNGIRAMARLLRTYRNNYGLNTIRGIIQRWTAGDSSTIQNNYVGHVVNKTGITEHLQLYSAAQYAAVVEQMIYFENGQQPYAKALIAQAVADGMA